MVHNYSSLRFDRRAKLSVLLLTLALLLSAYAPRTLYAQVASDVQPANQEQTQTVYLPIISSSGNGAPPGVTVTPTPSPTPLPPLSLTPEAVVAKVADPDKQIRPVNGQCPSGTHRVHAADGMGVFDAEDESVETQSEAINDNDYLCIPDQTVDAISCGVHGVATLVDGVAACACETGYAGASCNICAPGHSLDAASGQCRANPTSPPTAFVRGTDASLEVGESAIFSATSGAGNMIDATWSLLPPAGVSSASAEALVAEIGCLYALGADQSCKQTVNGAQVGFRAPTSLTTGSNVKMIQIQMRPAGALDFTTKNVVIVGEGGIPITGVGDSAMAPVLDALSSYMKQRCVGASVLGVSRYGYPLAVYGFGRMDGRASETWDPNCGDDMSKPLAPTVTNHTPMRVGSANKGITFGVLRWTLSERLKALDSDFALTAVADNRAVTVARAANAKIRVSTWLISTLAANSGNVVELNTLEIGMSAKAIDLVPLDTTRVAAIFRTPNDSLQFRLFNISDNGLVSAGSIFTIEQVDQKVVDFSAVKVLTLGNANPRFALVSRQNDGDINLRVVEVLGEGTFSVIGSYQTLGSTRDATVADVSGVLQGRVVVATRANDNSLKLRTYNIAANGQLSANSEISAGAVEELTLAALSENRVLAGVRTANGNLKVIIFDINAAGALTRRGEDEGGAISQLSLSALSDRMVAAAVRQSNGELKLITWLLSEDGELISGTDTEAGDVNGLEVQRLSGTRMLVAVRTQGNTLKNIVWDLPSATTLARRGDVEGSTLVDYPWSDAHVEALSLTGFDFPERMLPSKLIDVLSGVDQLPVAPIADSAAFGSLEGGHPLCTNLTDKADTQWQQVQISHILAHRTGLARSAPGQDYQLTRLAALRGLNSEADFIAQEAKLRAEYGDIAVDQGKDHLFYTGDEKLYVVPQPTIDEVLMLVAARCLRYPLGEHHYSNTSPVLGAAIVAHLRAPFAALSGYPEQHEGSALDQFFGQVLGIETTANSGIFASQRVLTGGSYVVREPVGRSWNGSTHYPQSWDAKRPHCVWTGSACSFTDWLDHKDQFGRLHWQWFVSPIHFVKASSDNAWGTSGGLAIEPGVYLSYMRNFWIAGYEEDPTTGAKRNNVWTVSKSHNGSAGGAYGYGLHYASDSATDFAIPYALEGGYMADQANTNTFRPAEAAYFMANPATGEVKKYNEDSINTGTFDMNIVPGNAFATGHSILFPNRNAFFVARHDSGTVEVYGPTSTVFNTPFGAGFAAGDGFLVDDLLVEDVYDEVVIGDTSNGEVRVYSSQGFPLKTLALNFAAGDRLGVGNMQGYGGANELFIARVATGAVQVYDTDGALLLTLNASFAPGDGLAVGDVVGSVGSADIVIANGLSGIVSVYTYAGNAYSLLTTFQSFYRNNSSVILREPLEGSGNREIVVMSLYDYGLRFQVEVNDEGEYEFAYKGGIPSGSMVGDLMATAHNGGKRLYSCALPDGTRQEFPDGVDVYVTLNQGKDKESQLVGNSSYYKILPNVIKYGLCQVDWSTLVVEP